MRCRPRPARRSSTSRASATSARRRSTKPGAATAARPAASATRLTLNGSCTTSSSRATCGIGDARSPAAGRPARRSSRTSGSRSPAARPRTSCQPVGARRLGIGEVHVRLVGDHHAVAGQLVQERRASSPARSGAGGVVGIAQPDQPRAAGRGRRRRPPPGRSPARAGSTRRHGGAAGRRTPGRTGRRSAWDHDRACRGRRTPWRSRRSAPARRGPGSPTRRGHAQPARPPRRGSRRRPAPGRAARGELAPRPRSSASCGGPEQILVPVQRLELVQPVLAPSARHASAPGS